MLRCRTINMRCVDSEIGQQGHDELGVLDIASEEQNLSIFFTRKNQFLHDLNVANVATCDLVEETLWEIKSLLE